MDRPCIAAPDEKAFCPIGLRLCTIAKYIFDAVSILCYIHKRCWGVHEVIPADHHKQNNNWENMGDKMGRPIFLL